MKSGLLISAFIVAMTVTSAFSTDQNDNKETRNVTGFTKVNFGVSGDLYITFGSEFKVVLEGSKSLLEDIETEVSGAKLTIKREKDNWGIHNNEHLTVYITMPEISGLGVSGSGKAEIKDAVKAEDLDFSVSGSGKIVAGEVNVSNFHVGISGSGNVVIGGNGEAGKVEISISGSGNYNGESLKIANAGFSISGSGSSKCYVTDNLEAHISGSGNITYSGNPRIDARVSGSGHVRSK
jgi:hypothetical protein